MRLSPVLTALSLLTALPAAAQLAPTPPPAGDEIQKAFARELDPRPLREFTTPAGVQGKAEAVGPVHTEAGQEDRGEQLVIALGSEEPIHCTVSESRVDPAASTAGLVAEVGKKLEIVSARPVEVATDGGLAILFTEVHYRQTTDKGALAGQLKIAVHPHGTHSLVCFHDEPGYSATFRRVVKGLAASLRSEREDDRASARFSELLVTEVAGLPVGYVERSIWEKEGGARFSLTYEAMILPRSPRDLMAIDQFTAEGSDAAGLLTSARAVHAVNGELDLDVELTPGDAPGTFAFKGTKAGKELAGTFTAREGLASELWFAQRLVAGPGASAPPRGKGKVKARPSSELAHATYAPSADPAGPTRVTYVRDPRVPGRVTLTLGPSRVKGELDDAGLMKQAELPVGPAVLTMKRVWSRGAP